MHRAVHYDVDGIEGPAEARVGSWGLIPPGIGLAGFQQAISERPRRCGHSCH